MRVSFPAAAALALILTASAVHAQSQFTVFARLAEASGQPLPPVTEDMIRVLEDGAEAKVVKIEPLAWPLKLQVLIDNGNGMGSENVGVVRKGLQMLVESLPADTEVTMVMTSPAPRYLVRPTKDRKALLQGIDRLSPDSGTGEFSASLGEALTRTEKDKTDHSSVIISVATTVGDASPNANDVSDISKALQRRRSIVHVVMITSTTQSAGGGFNQIDIAMNATKMSGGRYENINSPARLGDVLASLAEQIGKAYGTGGSMFRFTVQRPSGKSGNLGKIGFATRGNVLSSDIKIEQR